ncbi:hypothetical protein [uncultured Ilyobacter sp.]|uniref:hypothetical protein n=1 Tax=uncultured Ilyobacter sp. TaxID=544433 RepID=UPI0029C6EE22|nr:hypothetical protein [uncultured Ilyobacter sp.]
MRKLLSFLGALFLIFILFFVFMNFGMRRSFNIGNGYFGSRMMQGSHMMGYSYDDGAYRDGYMRMHRFQQLTHEEGKEYLKIKEESFKVYSKYGIDINKKQLELEAELLKENPEWGKVEDLNQEIGALEAKVRTEIMKINHDNTKR